jgi:hypothetical protein
MAVTYDYGYTNNTHSSEAFTPIVISTGDYAITVDSPELCVMKNITSPIDQPEVISYISSERESISMTEPNVHPSISQKARMITVKVENYKRESSDTNDAYVVDYPLTCNITWRFAKNRAFSSADLIAILERALGAIKDSDGTGTRLDNMMMQQLNPKSN